MIKIKFPKLQVEEKIGQDSKKNIIVHLIFDKYSADCESSLIDSNTLILKEILTNKTYYVTSKITDIPSDYEYVLLSKKGTKINSENSTLVLSDWLKHPQLANYALDTIINSWKNTFSFKEEDITDDVIGLRNPQIGAIHSILGHLTNANDIATVVLPTGTGKTETMLSVLVANRCKKLLVTVPSDALRNQLAGKFYDFGWLKKLDRNGKSILEQTAKYPKVGILNTGFKTVEELKAFFDKCNVIISTMDLVAGRPFEQIRQMNESCSHLFVDEAHHSKANNWNKFIRSFDKKKVIQFTATPYRNDGQILDGKIIYNFSLKEAQEQGYFKEINFIPIREYDETSSDIRIAQVAVAKLREDLANGYDHILMARCKDKYRASEVFKIYSEHNDLSPILIHSTILGKTQVKQAIVNKEHRIIVCVDMLGEGFDLPELKIAAFHDVRKSLPITLQFAGRFTRTSKDAVLGNASFIANLYQPNINDELSLLYAKESNWNSILPTLSLQATQEQVELREFLSGFNHLEESIIPLQDIRPAFSAVAYKNQTNNWHPSNFKNGIKGYDNYEHKFSTINSQKNVIIILLGSRKSVDWGSFNDVYNIEWDIYIVYWNQKNNLLFINSSVKGSQHQELANAIIGNDSEAVLIKDENVFKSFHKIDRVKLFNFGLRKGLGKDITFQSYYGKGVQEGLSLAEEKSGISNNVFGVGFENGEMTSIGCSRKGRIWSYSRGTINEFTNWCDNVGEKLSNDSIDSNILFKNSIKPVKCSSRPLEIYPISVDWHHSIYKQIETKIVFNVSGIEFDLSSSEINTLNPSIDGDLCFSFDTELQKLTFKLNLSERLINDGIEYNFEIVKTSLNDANVKIGNRQFTITEFFNEYPPKFWFHNGSFLQGNDYIKFNEDILDYPREEIIAWNWDGVSLGSESEGFENIKEDSIQFFCIQKLFNQDYDIIFNDDNSGEIADIVTVKNLENEISVELYHLKFASGGKVSDEIKNLYEVCGQAQKSLVWKYREGQELFNHLIKREIKKIQKGQTRLKKGSIDDLESLLSVAKRTKPVNYKIFIVQPGFSKAKAKKSILNLLGVTANHIKKEGSINLNVIASA